MKTLRRQFLCKDLSAIHLRAQINARNGSYVIVGTVVAGASWYLGRLAFGPTGERAHVLLLAKCSPLLSPSVIWTKDNSTPWNSIKPDEGTKIMQVNQKFDKRYFILLVVGYVLT